MADVLDKSAQEIRKRIAELEPLVAEHERLSKAIGAIESFLSRDAESGRAERRAPGSNRARRTTTRSPATQAKTRSSRRGRRADQFVALVERQPGITVPDAAKRLGTTPNAVYQLTSRLQKQGRIRKEGRGLHVAS